MAINGPCDDNEGAENIKIDGSLHTFDQIFKIIENSPVMYEVGPLDDTAAITDERPVLTPGMYYLGHDGDKVTLEEYSIPDSIWQLYSEGEKAFGDEDYEKALGLYNKAYSLYPTFSTGLTWIGDVYYTMDKIDTAITYYKKALEISSIDYSAHWFLGDAYWKLDEIDKAIEELTIAHLLNINHAGILKKLKYYRELGHRPWKDWDFQPKYTLEKDGNTVHVRFTEPWIGYALVKALWKYEPGYYDKMMTDKIEDLLVNPKEEKEAVLAALPLNENEKLLEQIIMDGYFQEFIDYEMYARKYPAVLLLFPSELFERMIEYVNKYH